MRVKYKINDVVLYHHTNWIINRIDNFGNFYLMSIYPDMRNNNIIASYEELSLVK